MSGTINLGRVRPIYLGDYDPGRAYSVLERVKYNGHIYECAANTTAGIAPDSADNGSAYWTQISVDNAVPEPVWEGTELSWQYPDGTTTEFVDLQGPAGPQGVPGPVNITSDLTSTDPDVALSALGGKTLNDKIGENSDLLEELKNLILKSLAPNDEIIITESGTWTVPYTGLYDVTIIGGGGGGQSTKNSARSGDTAPYHSQFMFLTKDAQIPVVIGAGKPGNNNYDNPPSDTFVSTETKFNNISNWESPYMGGFEGISIPLCYLANNTNYATAIAYSSINTYGAGGWARSTKNGANFYESEMIGENGIQGAVILRFYNPEKE